MLAIFLKVVLYYWMMDITISTVGMILFTVAIILLLYLGLNQSGVRKTLFLVFYFSITALMFGEVIYYRYFNTNLSIVIIQQAPKLYDVSDSVKGLVEIREFLLLLDLPIVTYFVIKGKHPKVNHYRAIFPLVVLLILFVSLNPFAWKSFTMINHQEVFTYHVTDILRTPEDVGLPEDYNVQVTEEVDIIENPTHFGMLKDRKIIVIQMESIQNFLVDLNYNGQEVMPFLSHIAKKDGLYFSNYYQQLGRGNTSDAEFVSHNSIYAPIHGVAYELYEQQFFRGLPWILRENGYSTNAYHGYIKSFWNRDNAYPNQGFERYVGGEDYLQSVKIGMGLADKSFLTQTVPYIIESPLDSYHFLITLTSHNPYLMPEESTSFQLLEEHKESLAGNYLRSARYVDEALELFITSLGEKDDLSDYAFVLYGDHFGLNCKDDEVYPIISDLLGESYEYNQMLNIPLIVYAPNSEQHDEISRVGGQIDFLPTMLNLLGIRDDGIMYGQDIVNAEQGFVASQTYMTRGSYITDDVVFEMARDGIFEHSIATDKRTGEVLPLDQCFDDYIRALTEIQSSMRLLESDALKSVNIKLDLEQSNKLNINDLRLNENTSYYNQYIDNFSTFRLHHHGSKVLSNSDNHRFYINVTSAALLNTWTKSANIAHDKVVPVIKTIDDITQYRYYGYERPLFDISNKEINIRALSEITRQEALMGIIVTPEQYEVIKDSIYNVPFVVKGTHIRNQGFIMDVNGVIEVD